jgi:hypothetical protein
MKNLALAFKVFMIIAAILTLTRCNHEDSVSASSIDDAATVQLLDVAQTSGQLASGTSFSISGSSTDSTGNHHHGGHGHHGYHKPHRGILDGINLLAATDELLAIIDAESAGDFRGLRISGNGGATITHYDADGSTVTLPTPVHNAPNGCSFSGKQFPEFDSLLATIVKTEIDFGTGVTYTRDTVTITRAGKIVINRSVSGNVRTEVTAFEEYMVNGIKIEGTKTRITTFDEATGSGTSATTLDNGKFTFADGSTATWESDRERTSNITRDAGTGKPVGGTIVTEVNTEVAAADGTIIYSHKTTSPLTESIACGERRHGPVSGTLDTVYRDDTVTVDYGNGSCENRTVTITLNGVTMTKTIGG